MITQLWSAFCLLTTQSIFIEVKPSHQTSKHEDSSVLYTRFLLKIFFLNHLFKIWFYFWLFSDSLLPALQKQYNFLQQNKYALNSKDIKKCSKCNFQCYLNEVKCVKNVQLKLSILTHFFKIKAIIKLGSDDKSHRCLYMDKAHIKFVRMRQEVFQVKQEWTPKRSLSWCCPTSCNDLQ